MDLRCPKCQASMRQYERNGVTIDQCSECRGVFLDRGELEHLVDAENSYYDRGGAQTDPRPAAAQPYPTEPHPSGYAQPRRWPGYSPGSPDSAPRYSNRGYRRRKSFLSELFD